MRSLRRYVELIEQYQGSADGPLWSRGVGRAGYQLEPSLFRLPPPRSIERLADVEFKLMELFRQRSVIYGTRSLGDDWERLFFMQHYGVPTRLLDWTENPFIAFFFAVMSARKERQRNGTYAYPDNAAVWLLDPVIWNRRSLSHISFPDGILSVGDSALSGYSHRKGYKGMNMYPVCMFGVHNSQRIINQRGVFSVFGQGMEPMDVAYDTFGFPVGSLRKIELPRNLIDDFRKAIVDCGITDSVVYPDLGGLALEIKRQHGFEV